MMPRLGHLLYFFTTWIAVIFIRCWAFDLFLFRSNEHGPSWIGSRRLGCPYLAWGPCDPVLAC
jgi:hypothetical protein